MATTTKRTQQTIGDYYAEMSELIGVKTLKAIRIAYVTTVLLAVQWIAVEAGADPATVTPWIVGGILLVAGVEIAELEALKKLTSLSISLDDDRGRD